MINQKPEQTFAILGLPETLVSVNGAVFSSLELQEFEKQNGITHLKTASYHHSYIKQPSQTNSTSLKIHEVNERRISRILIFCLNTE